VPEAAVPGLCDGERSSSREAAVSSDRQRWQQQGVDEIHCTDFEEPLSAPPAKRQKLGEQPTPPSAIEQEGSDDISDESGADVIRLRFRFEFVTVKREPEEEEEQGAGQVVQATAPEDEEDDDDDDSITVRLRLGNVFVKRELPEDKDGTANYMFAKSCAAVAKSCAPLCEDSSSARDFDVCHKSYTSCLNTCVPCTI